MTRLSRPATSKASQSAWLCSTPVIARLARYGGLLRQHDFRQLWVAQGISQFGTQITVLALPLAAILVLDASAFEVAALEAVEFLPFLLFGLPAGAWVDRLPRRSILMAADLGRAAVLALVPIAYLFDVLAMWQLFVVAFVAGALSVFFDVAYLAVLPELVERDRLAEGNSRLEITRSAAQVLGPGAGGFLVGLLTAPIAIAADALSYLGSAAFLARIRTARQRQAVVTASAPRAGLLREILEGLRFYAANAYLRATSAAVVSINLGVQISMSIYLVFVVRELGLGPEVIGLTLSVGSIGLVVGAASATEIGRRLGVGRAMILAFLAGSLSLLLIGLAPPELAIGLLVTAGLLQGMAFMQVNVNGVSLRQAVTPDELQGRVNATGRWINWSILPVASIIGGALATAVGLRATILIGAALAVLSVPWLLFSPIRTLREIPTQPPSGADGRGPLPPTPFPAGGE
jgi:MFS family permease